MNEKVNQFIMAVNQCPKGEQAMISPDDYRYLHNERLLGKIWPSLIVSDDQEPGEVDFISDYTKTISSA